MEEYPFVPKYVTDIAVPSHLMIDSRTRPSKVIYCIAFQRVRSKNWVLSHLVSMARGRPQKGRPFKRGVQPRIDGLPRDRHSVSLTKSVWIEPVVLRHRRNFSWWLLSLVACHISIAWLISATWWKPRRHRPLYPAQLTYRPLQTTLLILTPWSYCLLFLFSWEWTILISISGHRLVNKISRIGPACQCWENKLHRSGIDLLRLHSSPPTKKLLEFDEKWLALASMPRVPGSSRIAST